MTNMIKNKLEIRGFNQLVWGPNRFWPNCDDSLVDHVWTNTPDSIISVRNIVVNTADHNILELNIRLKGKCSNSKEVIRRIITNYDLSSYRQQINQINWENFYKMTDVNVAYNFFLEAVVKVLEDEAPMKKVQISKKHKSWLSSNTRKLIEKRNFF